MQLNILAVETLDIVAGQARMAVYLRTEWIDPRLAWNPDDYNGLENTFFGTDPVLSRFIYTPEVYCSTCVSNSFTYTRARGNYTGGIFWSRYGILTIILPFNVKNFPYDTQTVSMNFYLWGLPEEMQQL